MASILQDIGYALRTLGRSPGFTAVVVLTLGLGIGANTTVFSLVDTILLQPPAGVAAPESLVDVYTSDYSGPPFGGSSYPDYEDFAANVDELSGLTAFQWQPFSVSTGGEAFRAFGEYASDNYFHVLGVTPALGRSFDADESSGDDVVTAVIGYGLWQQRFGGANDIIGRTLRVRGHPVTVIGVAPKGFTGTQSAIGVELWVPYRLQTLLAPSTAGSITDRGSRGLFLVGRLARGATADSAQAAFDAQATNLHATYPAQWTDVRGDSRRITVLEHRQAAVMPEIRGAVVSFLTILGAVAALVLAITCANIANLLLTRAGARAREIGIRTALGATRRRILRLLLAESLLLASLGGLCGVALAAAASEFLIRLKPPIPIPIVLNLAPGSRVLVFAAVLSALTGMLLGTLPALRATRVRLGHGLSHDALTPAPGRRLLTLRNALVVGQVAVSSALLVVMGLFVQSLLRAQVADLGFRPDHVALASFDLEAQGYTAERTGQFLDTLEDTARRIPGVRSATFARRAPLGLDYARRGVRIEDYQPGPSEDMEVGNNVIDEDYFLTLGIELHSGRAFSTRDRQGAPPVAIVNDAFVRRYWPDGKALGRHIDFGAGPAEVIGVVADAKYRSIRDEALPYFYMSRRQNPALTGTLEMRTDAEPSAVFPALRASLSALDPAVPFELATMREHLGVAVLAQRVGASLIGAFGGIGALLAALGLYGVLSYLVARRTREIGIRMALGSDSLTIMRMVLRRAAGLTAVGLAFGLAGAFAVARLVSGFLYGIDGRDPATFVAAGIFFTAIALAAALGPARRATRVDPTDALRSE
jgi:predicted permease